MNNRFHKAVNILLVAILAGGNLMATAAQAAPDTGKDSLNGFNLSGQYSLISGQPTGEGAFDVNGLVGAYPEGSCLPALAEINNNDTQTKTISFDIEYEYKHQGGDENIG